MKNLKLQIRATMIFGVIAIIAGLLAHLALTIIAHGEQEVSLEWQIVQVAALVILSFVMAALFTLRRALQWVTNSLSGDFELRNTENRQ